MNDKKEYLQPCPLSVLQELLESHEDPYSVQLAAQSMLLDWHSGLVPGEDRLKVEYARMWERSPSWVSRHWDEIRRLAHRYRTFYREDEEDGPQKCHTNGSQICENGSQTESGLDGAEGRKSEGGKNATQTHENGSQTARKTYNTESLDILESEVCSSCSSRAPAREDSPSGDSLPDADDIEVEPSLGFLPEDYEVYTSSIRGFIGEYAPEQFDQLLKRAWENVPFTWSDGADLASEHDWPVFVAAVVVAANEADRPNLRYLETIIESFNNPDCSNEQRDSQKRPSQSGAPAGRGGQWGDYA